MASIRVIVVAVLVFGCVLAKGQNVETMDSLLALPDSVRPFPIEQYFSLILQNHPVAKQADLLPEVARQEIRLARGNFDPKLEAEAVGKTYDDKEYYSRIKSSIKFPTLIPINPSIGVDRHSGPYLNPEQFISDEFNQLQYNVGISVPLGRGLITDERRAALKQAQLFQQMTQAEQIKIINDLLLDAAYNYWSWYYAFNNYKLMSQSLDLAAQVFSMVMINHELGEAAAIDTLQAKVTLQQRMLEQQEALLAVKNAGVSVSNALWDSLGNPLALDLNWAPVLETEPWTFSRQDLDELAALARENHPDLRKLEVKLDQLEVERRLAAECLKPQVDLNYNALNQPINPNQEAYFDPAGSYKFGVTFSMAIFLRKERSKLALTKLKVSHTEFEQSLKKRQIENELTAAYNELTNQRVMMDTQRGMMQNYQMLLNSELLNLNEGESDLFKINIQQEKLIQAQTKWLKLIADFEKQKAYLYWAAGLRPL